MFNTILDFLPYLCFCYFLQNYTQGVWWYWQPHSLTPNSIPPSCTSLPLQYNFLLSYFFTYHNNFVSPIDNQGCVAFLCTVVSLPVAILFKETDCLCPRNSNSCYKHSLDGEQEGIQALINSLHILKSKHMYSKVIFRVC